LLYFATYQVRKSPRFDLAAPRIRNQLTELPLRFGHGLRELKVLMLADNMLTALPNSICGLTNVEEFDIRRNSSFHVELISTPTTTRTLYLANQVQRKSTRHVLECYHLTRDTFAQMT
jgi:Leucine-rich repeat (LRR) protein